MAPLGLLLLAAALLTSGATAVRVPGAQPGPSAAANPCAGAPASSIIASKDSCQAFIYCCDGEAFPNVWWVTSQLRHCCWQPCHMHTICTTAQSPACCVYALYGCLQSRL